MPGVLWLFIALVSFRKQVIECITALPYHLLLLLRVLFPSPPPSPPPQETLTVPLQLHCLQPVVRTLSKSVAAEGEECQPRSPGCSQGTSAAVIPNGLRCSQSARCSSSRPGVEWLSSFLPLPPHTPVYCCYMYMTVRSLYVCSVYRASQNNVYAHQEKKHLHIYMSICIEVRIQIKYSCKFFFPWCVYTFWGLNMYVVIYMYICVVSILLTCRRFHASPPITRFLSKPVLAQHPTPPPNTLLQTKHISSSPCGL